MSTKDVTVKVSAPAPGIRARNRAALEAEILSVATRQLGEVGAAGLSLRAVAREMGMASSAIYRYVENRDELLTRLIVAAFNSLGDYAETVNVSSKRRKPKARLRLVALAIREWALDHPHEWALIYGSPVPDYQAPDDRTTAAGIRVPQLLAQLLSELAGGKTFDIHQVEMLEAGAGDPTLVAGIASWTLIVGAISSEIFGHLGPGITSPDDLFDAMIDAALTIVLSEVAS